MTVKDYLFYQASQNKIPLGGTFELTPVCNFSCRMCYVRKSRGDMKREGKREAALEDWIRLGRECRDAGMLYLLLTGGEPFLYPGFHRLYEALQDMGLLLSVNSNGSMIDAKELAWLKDHAPARMNITLYGASPETYGRICGNPDGYEKTVWAIRALREAGIAVVINASIIPENAGDLEAIIGFGQELGVAVHAATYMFPPVRRCPVDTDSRLTPEESGRLLVMKQHCMMERDTFLETGRRCLETYEKRQAERLTGRMADSAGQERDQNWGDIQGEPMKCRAGRSTFWVSWEGRMTTCGIMDFPAVENPFQTPFLDCWRDLNEKVRRAVVLRECRGCPKEEICHPCAAIIHAETGDVNKKAPYLCQMSDAAVKYWREMILQEEKNGIDIK